MSFRYKFVLAFILIEAFFILLMVVFNTHSLKTTSETLVMQKIDAASEIFIEIVKNPIIVNDLATLDDAAANFTAISNIAEVHVLGNKGELLSESYNPSPSLSSKTVRDVFDATMSNPEFISGSEFEADGRQFYAYSKAITIDEEPIGEIRFIYDVSDSIQTLNENTGLTHLLATVALVISTAIAILLGFRITRQLKSLTHTANEIANDNPVVVPDYKQNGDEIDELYSAMKTMQRNIIERTQEMTAARSRAQVASKAKSEFLAVMSHEIRTPLNGMIGSLNLMDKKRLSPEDSEHLATVHQSSALLVTIINDILDYSKIEAGKFSLDQHVIDLEQLTNEVGQFYRPIMAEKGLLMDVQLKGISNRYVKGDAIRIKQILNNYLNNALKFTSQGYIHLQLEQTGESDYIFRVIDTGIGINPGDIQNLFKDFSQVNTGATRRFGGTGLGLAISKRLAVLMGGNVGVESEFGKGSCFWATLKLEPETQAAHKLQHQSQETSDENVLEGVTAKVLLVEDNKVNQMVARKLLEKRSCIVTIANNGVEALDALQVDEFDIVLMDCQMPVMDGYEATRQIRASGNTVPVIALTANAQTSDRDACLKAGMNDFLSKPFDPRVLYQIISRYSKKD